jgi:hypothetical protein
MYVCMYVCMYGKAEGRVAAVCVTETCHRMSRLTKLECVNVNRSGFAAFAESGRYELTIGERSRDATFLRVWVAQKKRMLYDDQYLIGVSCCFLWKYCFDI